MGNVSYSSSLFYVSSSADFVQGAKANQKRERNAEKNAPKGAKSQSKANEAAKKIVCSICKQPFVSSFRLSFPR
jgi:4F5 protein related disordered region